MRLTEQSLSEHGVAAGVGGPRITWAEGSRDRGEVDTGALNVGDAGTGDVGRNPYTFVSSGRELNRAALSPGCFAGPCR